MSMKSAYGGYDDVAHSYGTHTGGYVYQNPNYGGAIVTSPNTASIRWPNATPKTHKEMLQELYDEVDDNIKALMSQYNSKFDEVAFLADKMESLAAQRDVIAEKLSKL